MTAYELETVGLLKRIDATLTELLALSKSKRAGTPMPAAAIDLEGPYGDPLIKAKDPRDWNGPSMNGRHLSECPPEYLDLLASRYDYFAGKEEDEKKKRYAVIDAAKARAWAARLRSGYQPKAPEPMMDEGQIKW
jgi:hypothetical protein